MRRWLAYLLVAFFSLALVLSTGCPNKSTLKDTPEEGEEQPDPGPEDPRPTNR